VRRNGYDEINQLTGADYDFQTDESYSYDANGNRTNTGYATGDHNRLTSDGTYNYTYDNEGNVTSKTNISTSESVEYTWDHRNRLVKVTFKDDEGTPTKIVEYAYDHAQRWVRKTLDTNADETIEESRVFVHDNGQIVLDFQKTGTGAASNSDLARRYLWGAAVDQLLAEESIDGTQTAEDVGWALTDHLGSVRDLAVYDEQTATTSVAKHVTYDAFGNVTSDTAPAVKSLFLYTARPFDADTGLQNNLNRWYDPGIGRWIAEDAIESDLNLYRYVLNSPTMFVDPLGLAAEPLLTGACNIWIYAGHGIWPLPYGEDPAVKKFREAHDVPNENIITGCGNYLAYVGCKGATLNAKVTTKGRRVPDYEGFKGPAEAGKMLNELQKALAAARDLQKKLCENRKKFCDDGTGEQYQCGENMRRCDSVTIHVHCDADMKVLMKTGKYQKRLFPGGPVIEYLSFYVPELPTDESKAICGLSEKKVCCKKT